jgi:RNA polymerase sigma-70 factor (ECF subfamily)
MELSDGVLVRRTLEGDDSAFRMLINRHSGVVHGLCYHLAHNFTDAADLAQEAFIKAYLKLSSLSNPSKFLSWLRQITLNVCHDWLRRQQNNTVPLEAVSRLSDTSSSPQEICEAEELREKVAEAIASLSEKNRQVVMLYYLDGCSCSEVSDFLDVSVSVVQSRLYESRKQLKRELITMVKEDLESRKLPKDFDEKVLEAIEQARKAKDRHVYREVIKYCDEALDVLAKLPDSVEHKKMKRQALRLKGEAVKPRKEAIRYYEQALELEMEVGDKLSQAEAIYEMGRHYSNIGNVQKAIECYERALEMFTELGGKSGQAKVLHSLAHRSNTEDGIAHYQRAMELFAEVGDKKWEASCRAGVNLLNHFGKQIEEAVGNRTPSRIVYQGALCETFVKSPDGLLYDGKSGTFGAYMYITGDELKDTFNASPFRFLPGSKTKLLSSSPSVGDDWSMYLPSGGMDPMKITVTIESDSETVSVPAGEFSSCLKTKIVTSEEPVDCEENRRGEREFVYAPGVGLVKASFIRYDGALAIAQLTEYEVSDGKEDYFPLTIGNKWVYEWADKEGVFPSTDVLEVTGMDNNQYYVSHYYYALKQHKSIEPIQRAREAQNQHAYRESIKYCDEAMDELAKLPTSVEYKRMKKEALELKARALNRHASRKEAIKYYEQALEIEMEIGSKPGQAHALWEMGAHYSNAGDEEKAVEYFKRALDMYTEIGDRGGRAKVLMFLGGNSLLNRNVKDGLSYYRKAHDIFKDTGRERDRVTCQAGVSLLKQFGKQIEQVSFEEGPSRVLFTGAVSETFSKSSSTVMYLGVSGSFGTYPEIEESEFKDTTFNASPFRFLPDVMKILDLSLSVDDNWSTEVPAGGLDPMKITVSIESDSETVSVPAGEFSNCLKTKIVTSEEPEDCVKNLCGEREFVYAPGVGLVKCTSVRRDGAVAIAQLMKYRVSEGDNDYFPLAIGNKWIYEWADKEGRFPSTDVYEVAGMGKDHYYVSHYYYALKEAKA